MRGVIASLIALMGGVIFADDAVSPAFTFDARYKSSGITPDAWVSHEAKGLSSRFSAATVTRAADANGNGIPDEWESRYGLVGDNADTSADPDGDGRTNLEEYNAGTNPIIFNDWSRSIAEQDKSFICDTHVEYIGGNPTFDSTFAVIKVSNGFICDTGGLYYDWDGDGIPNWWEARFSRNGSKTGLDASTDDDADGMSNYGEFVAYTNPTNGNSRFTIAIVPVAEESAVSYSRQPTLMTVGRRLSNGAGAVNFALRWQSAKGRNYSVYATSDLSEGWSDVPVAEITGTGNVVEYIPSETGAAMFFKVIVSLSDDY